MLKIASFNVNSIKARLPRLLAWLAISKPDIVCLQELKCLEAEFPFEILADAGYNAAVCGQKTYNGVAILSKFKIEDVIKTLPNLASSLENEELVSQARYIEAVISLKNSALRVASIYVPNGGSELAQGQTLEQTVKFCYKLQFFDALRNHISSLLPLDETQVFGGDFNVACDELDIYDPKGFDGQLLFHSQERQKMRQILNLGVIDSYRMVHRNSQAFSWWDYRGNSWNLNKGARIDYLLTSPKAADLISNAEIEDKGVRDQEKASDHCPVVLELDN